MPDDRNFDDLAHRFHRNVYSSLKGQIRLEVLRRDFADFLPQSGEEPWQVLDAGGGQGRMSAYFAERGHRVLLCDISAKMLDLARSHLTERGLASQVDIRQQSIQSLTAGPGRQFDVVVCHAVLEWVSDPRGLVRHLAGLLRPGGMLSLVYYNVNGLIYKNLLRTNFKKIRREDWKGFRGSLTPSNPLRPEQVLGWLTDLPLEICCESGVRVFHDYIFDQDDRRRDPAGIIEMELHHSRLPPFTRLGRYIHLLCRKTP